MANRPSSFKQADVTRALKAAQKAGLEVATARVMKETGDIVMTFGQAKLTTDNPCDELLK